MNKAPVRLLPAMFLIAALAIPAYASNIPAFTPIPVGFISYNVTGANVAEFDIVNFTGPNASTFPDTTFPITTSLSLMDLSLTVDFMGGQSQVFGSSYFTLDSDGLSFDGKQLSTLSGFPTGLFGATSATLAGEFSTQNVLLNDGSSGQVFRTFDATISDPSGLSDGDLVVINATTIPEPATWMMLATGLLLLMGMGLRERLRPLTSKRLFGITLGLGLAALLLPAAAKAQATVKLNAVTSPSSGTAGTSTVNVTGTGFPTGTILPANVLVSVASTCGGAPTSVAATTVQKVLGSTDKVGFVIPGSLAAGTYFVSASGVDSNSVTFSSSTCSTLQVLPGVSPTLTINATNPVDWVISNGAMTIDFNSTSGMIWSVVPAGTQDQLIDFSPGNASIHGVVFDPANGESAISGTTIPAGWPGTSGIPGLAASFANKEPKGFYMDLSGFGAVAPSASYNLTSGYLDWWTHFPSSATGTTNNFTYEEHFVVTPNDMGIHIYFVVNHSATDATGSIGQVQWIFRDNVNAFTNLYNVNADLSMSKPVITPLPSVDDCFSSDNGRNVEDVTGRDTIDLHPQVGVINQFSPVSEGGAVPDGFHRHFCVKYDYSSYEYLHPAHGLFGPKYGLWAVFTGGHDTFVAGPGKQNLDFTGGILTIEAMSNHYQTGDVTISYPKGTVLSNRLFGPFYVRINQFGGNIQTPDDMYNDALAAGASFTDFYNNENTLLSNGYVPTTARGSVSVQVNGVAGAPKTAWAVLSQPGVNQISSVKSYQYTTDISNTGSGTFTNVVPGTYRLSVFKFGQFGEYRNDSIVVNPGQNTAAPSVTFQPENFGTQIGMIGFPDRSSHEFLHGANTVDFPDQPLGFDDREYYGNWNYWADFASTNGAVIYNLTAGPNGSATNNPLAWNYAHWGGFNPAIYGAQFPATPNDDTTDGYLQLIPSYVSTLPGASGTKGTTTPLPPWQVHFTTAGLDQTSYNFVVLTLALSATQGAEKVSLNGTPALTYTPSSSFNSDAIERSGLSGYYQLVTFQWPVSALNTAGQDNVITTQTSGVNSQDSDDALRVELSVNGAAPSVTGWHDYTFVTSGTTTAVNDTVPNP